VDAEIPITAGGAVGGPGRTDPAVAGTGEGVDHPTVERVQVPLVEEAGGGHQPGKWLVHDLVAGHGGIAREALGQRGHGSDVMVLQARARGGTLGHRFPICPGRHAVHPEVGEGGLDEKVDLALPINTEGGNPVGHHRPGRRTIGVITTLLGGAHDTGDREQRGLGGEARIVVLVHVDQHVDRLLVRPTHHLGDAVDVGGAVGPRRGSSWLQLTGSLMKLKPSIRI
jgi:hypothetical protein